MNPEHTAEQAASDLKRYARSMIRGDDTAGDIEAWGLYGYPPEIVSTVLSCVATGLPLDAAIHETTCAAAQALRSAFPEIAAQYTAEELEGKEIHETTGGRA